MIRFIIYQCLFVFVPNRMSAVSIYTHGYLELILGPMFSGKTTRLIQIYKTYSYIGKKIMVINYSADTRYHDAMLSTHDQMMIPCIFLENLKDVWTNDLHPYWNDIHNADVILINEGQFFPDLFDMVLQMVEVENKQVYICGLDGDFKRNAFGRILELIPYCNVVNKLKSLCAVCKDGTEGIFSHRITNELSQVVIGSNNYIPLCRKCYLSKSK